MSETYINQYPVATAGSGITSGATSLTVSNAASVDSGFRILVESELMLVTSGGTTTTWTVTRGVESTTAASHVSGITIYVVMTAGGLSNILGKYSPLLEAHTASNSAGLQFTSWYSSAYDDYTIEIVNLLPATNSAGFYLQCSTNGGSSYDSGSNYSGTNIYWYSGGSGLAGGTGTNCSLDTGNCCSTATYGGYNATLKMFGPGSGNYTLVLGSGMHPDTSVGNAPVGLNHMSRYNVATAVNAFQVIASSGNITSGSVRVYGVSA